MKQIKPGPGFTIFLLFFGIALLDSVKDLNVWRIVFWILMGTLFLVLDLRRKKV